MAPNPGQDPKQPASRPPAAPRGDDLTQATQPGRGAVKPPPEAITAMTLPMGVKPPAPADQRTMATQAGTPGGDNTMATLAATEPMGDPTVVKPGTVWGDFEFETLLGKGGMGAVYRGRQISLDRKVAIKVLPPHLSHNEGFRKRFVLEAQAVAKINSPHVIQVYTAGEFQGHHYFVMEYVEGQDLSRRLKDGFKPSHREAIDLVTQAGRGLVAAGEQGIIHRDIKPGNMMVAANGHLKLMDFGLVKLAKENSGLTMTGTVMGTVSYFSPEQGRGEKCDQRTDIYALGVVLYELLTGRLPFTGNDATSIIYQHIHEEPKLPQEVDPSIPEDLQAVVLKCMQKDPANRYQTAADLVADLNLITSGQAPRTAFFDPETLRSGATLRRATAFTREKKSSRAPLIVGAAVLLAAGGAGAWYALRDRVVPPPLPPPRTAGVPSILTPVTGKAEDQARSLAEAQQALADGRLARVGELLATAGAPGARAAAWEDLQAAYDRQVQASSSGKRIELVQQEAKALLSAGAADQALVALTALRPASEQAGATVLAETDRLIGAARRMKEFLSTAEAGLVHNDLQTARQNFLASQQDCPNEAAARGAKVVPLCEEFENALRADNPEAAAGHLERIRALVPDDRVVIPRQGRLEVLRVVVAVDGALVRGDLATAKEQLARLQQIDAGNKRIATFQVKLEVRELGVALDRALAAKDLPEAQRLAERIKTLDEGGKAWQDAEARLRSSRLEEELKAKAAGERAAAVEKQAAALRALFVVPKPDLAAAEQALAAFEKDLQPAEKAVADALRAEFIERSRQMAVLAALAEIDRAVLAGDRKRLGDLVRDAGHAEALGSLIGQEGLKLAHAVTAWAGKPGAECEAEVGLTTAMKIMPERVLRYRYRLRLDDGAWRVVAVQEVKDAAP